MTASASFCDFGCGCFGAAMSMLPTSTTVLAALRIERIFICKTPFPELLSIFLKLRFEAFFSRLTGRRRSTFYGENGLVELSRLLPLAGQIRQPAQVDLSPSLGLRIRSQLQCIMKK